MSIGAWSPNVWSDVLELSELRETMARSERFELPTLGIEIRCSIQLSYERVECRDIRLAQAVLRRFNRERLGNLVSLVSLADQQEPAPPSAVEVVSISIFGRKQ
jgi:hypothetical protein